MRVSRFPAVVLPAVALPAVVAVVLLAAGLAACGRVPAAGGQPGAPAAGTTVTVPPGTPGAGSASAGTGSAAPAITVSAAATAATGISGAPPAPTAAPTLTGPATVTAADSGGVVYLRVGQEVTVVLTPAFMSWHLPSAAGAALRRVSASGGFPGRQPARAVFLAVAPGTATLTDMSDAACLHSHPRCMIPQELWQLTVRVVS